VLSLFVVFIGLICVFFEVYSVHAKICNFFRATINSVAERH